MRLTWGDRTWDVDEFTDAVDTTQLALRHVGVRPGHRVAAITSNTPFRVLLQAACDQEEFVLVPIHRSVPEKAMGDQIRRADAVVAVTDDGELRNRLKTDVPVVKANPRGDRWDQLQRFDLPEPVTEPAALSAILFTSGTTGTPRPVGIPRTALAAHAEAAKERLGLGADDEWLSVLPLYHMGGFSLVDRCVRFDNHLILHDRFDVKAVLAAFRNGPATHASLVPTMLRRMLKHDDANAPGTVRCVLVGGDRTPEDLARQALERAWPVYASYGMTETCGQAATATPDDLGRDPATVGRPLNGVTIRIVDETGEDVAAGEDGEIVVSGATIGYRLGQAGPGESVATGDRGHLDEDGFLYVVGRGAGRIVTGGVNVDPSRVADVLRGHPAVVEASVVGLDDDEWGQIVAAALVMQPGAAVGVDELRTHCGKHLASDHVPRRFLFLKQLPKTPTGKPDPSMVRKWLERQAGATTPR